MADINKKYNIEEQNQKIQEAIQIHIIHIKIQFINMKMKAGNQILM